MAAADQKQFQESFLISDFVRSFHYGLRPDRQHTLGRPQMQSTLAMQQRFRKAQSDGCEVANLSAIGWLFRVRECFGWSARR
jgi:hypothetical protein